MWLQHVNAKSVGALAIAGSLLSAPNRRAHDHIGDFNFKVEIEGVTAGFFKGVSGLSMKMEVIEYQDGDDLILRKRPGRVKYGDITLKKGYIASDVLWKWREAAMTREFQTQDGTLYLLDDEGKEVQRYNFFEAWPCKWQSDTMPSSSEPDLLRWTLEVRVNRIEMS